ncbi:hypothetical protein Lal_00039804 [Lupinus albus]|nr:hypothetical protein Lal_00039804 [Lupinus albus]
MNSIIGDDADFDKYIIENYNSSNCKLELDRYLEESLLPRTKCECDISNWWETNEAKYHTLQMIAKDLLAIPISTVASESTFSTSSRFLTPHHRSSKSREDFNFITNTILDDIDDDDVNKFIDVLIYKEPIDPCVVDGEILDI